MIHQIFKTVQKYLCKKNNKIELISQLRTKSVRYRIIKRKGEKMATLSWQIHVH